VKRKRKVTLPRVTLMAYSRRDLLAFCEAVEALRHIVDDLRVVGEQLAVKVAAAPARSTARKPSKGAKQEPPQPPSAGDVGGEVQP
jgi:hypothetical protein